MLCSRSYVSLEWADWVYSTVGALHLLLSSQCNMKWGSHLSEEVSGLKL